MLAAVFMLKEAVYVPEKQSKVRVQAWPSSMLPCFCVMQSIILKNIITTAIILMCFFRNESYVTDPKWEEQRKAKRRSQSAAVQQCMQLKIEVPIHITPAAVWWKTSSVVFESPSRNMQRLAS
jgi:hypothetical protein